MKYRPMMWVAGFVCIAILCTGCEPLRKKFTRKKKISQKEDISMIPVLEPQEYPTPEQNPQENYAQHYSLVKVFYKDLWVAIEERRTVKNAFFAVNQVITHLDEMRKLLKPQHQGEIDKLKDLLVFYQESLKKEPLQRNRSRMESDLRAFDRQLRRACNPTRLKDVFIEAMDAHETPH